MVWCYGLSSWLKKSVARAGYELQKKSMIIHWKDNGYVVICSMAILATITPRRIIVQMRNMRHIRLQSHDMLCISWPKKLNNIWHLSAPIFISFPLLVLLFYCASGLSFSIQNESLEQKNTDVVLLSVAKYSDLGINCMTMNATSEEVLCFKMLYITVCVGGGFEI